MLSTALVPPVPKPISDVSNHFISCLTRVGYPRLVLPDSSIEKVNYCLIIVNLNILLKINHWEFLNAFLLSFPP